MTLGTYMLRNSSSLGGRRRVRLDALAWVTSSALLEEPLERGVLALLDECLAVLFARSENPSGTG